MGVTHIRTPKNFVLEERLERYADGFETHPESLAGRWAEACYPLRSGTCDRRRDGQAKMREDAPGSSASPCRHRRFDHVELDLGCGKGAYIIQAARQRPDTLFLGMDAEPLCIAYAAQYILESGLPNVLAIPRGADSVPRVFAKGELSGITLNFSTPFPRAHDVRRRLTTAARLDAYRGVLAPGGTITLRTDSQPLRDWTLTQLAAAGYKTLWTSDDTRAEHPELPTTEYESRLVDRGARVWGVCATPGDAPSREQLESALEADPSLMSYLPDDLENLDYVPLGMEDAVRNFINRRRRAAMGARQKH